MGQASVSSTPLVLSFILSLYPQPVPAYWQWPTTHWWEVSSVVGGKERWEGGTSTGEVCQLVSSPPVYTPSPTFPSSLSLIFVISIFPSSTSFLLPLPVHCPFSSPQPPPCPLPSSSFILSSSPPPPSPPPPLPSSLLLLPVLLF